MSSTYFHSALETIKNNMIWIYPEFTTSLIQALTQGIKIPTQLLNSLTFREQEVALLMRNGLSNQDIAQDLNISINTVKTHIKNIYEKANVKNRLAFMLYLKSEISP